MILALALAFAPAASSFGQFEFDESGLGALLGGDDENQVTVSAQFTPATGDRPAVLMVTADIAPQWHIYPLKMAGGIGLPTKITIDDSPQYRVIGSFAAIPEPQIHKKDIAGKTVDAAEHAGQVTFYVPIDLSAGTDPNKLTIRGKVDLLVCKDDGQCVPKELPFAAQQGKGVPIGPLALESSAAPTANDAPPLEGPVSTGNFRAKDSEVTWTGWLEPAQITPGGNATLHLKAEPTAGWHIYARADQVPKIGSKPTLIVVTHPAGLELFEPQTTAEAVPKDYSKIGFGVVRQHEGMVTWTIPLRVPDSATLGKHTLGGILAYQACESGDDGLGSCEIPTGVRFQVPVEVVAATDGAATQPVSFAAANYSDAAKALGDVKPLPASPPEPSGELQLTAGPTYELDKVEVEYVEGSLFFYLGLAFLGGLILNLMPCVLPVIGLKVMSFVEQAGHNRKKALTLNLWYAAGIVSVFVVLAAVAATSSSFSWGQQSSSTLFNVVLVSVVFAMALSLLGVWEIPIPGFIGGGSVQQAAAKEGITGAFLKGIVTTILAIPCTGPFMATALGWALDKPALTTFQVFAAMGFGMASPYILVGVYPQLLRFLPKPGMWMEIFKQAMGFVLLATVVFILSYMESPAVVPTVALLAGIALACWLFARTPATAEFNDRVQTSALSAAIVAGSALFAFGYLYSQVMVPRFDQRVGMLAAATSESRVQSLIGEFRDVTSPAEIDGAIQRFEAKVAADTQGEWQPFSLRKLGQLAIEDGRTVLVDFSAEWCVTCKTLEQTVLHTEPVDQAIRAGNIVTLYADFTNFPPEIQETIKALRSSGVPVIAVFPGNDPYRPIVFRGPYTQSGIIEALEKATGRKLDAAAVAMQASAGAPLPQGN